jgi:hypothetical protein
MSKVMNPIAALKRLVEDEGAPCAARVLALKQIAHPPLCLLRQAPCQNIKSSPASSILSGAPHRATQPTLRCCLRLAGNG